LQARKRVLEKKITETVRKEERERMEAEQARLARLSVIDRQVHEARTKIVEELLTLRCPRPDCQQAFIDFEGCFALKCGRCGCGFCAWCLADCGEDAHQHVAACPHKGGRGREYYGTQEEFNAHQNQRRKRLVEAFLGELVLEIRMQVVHRCRKDLEDVGMGDLVARLGGANGAGHGNGAGGAVADAVDIDELLALQLMAEEDDEDLGW
jgi:hypothetical protein